MNETIKKKSKLKEDLLKIYHYLSFIRIIVKETLSPFLIMFALLICLPYLKAVSIRWVWVLCILLIGIDFALGRIERAWEKDISVDKLIESNKEKIKELSEDIEKLQKLNLDRIFEKAFEDSIKQKEVK